MDKYSKEKYKLAEEISKKRYNAFIELDNANADELSILKFIAKTLISIERWLIIKL